MRAARARRAVVFPLPVGARVARRAAVFQLAVRAGVARHALAFHLPVRAGVAVRAAAFQLPVRVGVTVHAVAFQLPVRAGVTLCAVAFQPPAVLLHLAVGTRVAHRAVALLLPVRAPLYSHHSTIGSLVTVALRAHYVCAQRGTTRRVESLLFEATFGPRRQVSKTLSCLPPTTLFGHASPHAPARHDQTCRPCCARRFRDPHPLV
jgi:hypothetical protein